MDHCQHVTNKKKWASSTSEFQKTRGMAGHAAQQHVFCTPENSQLVKTETSSVLDHDSIQEFGHSLLLPLRHFPATTPEPWRVTSNVIRSTDTEAVELPIIGFCRPSPRSRKTRATILCKTKQQKESRHQHLQPPRCDGP